MSIDKREIEAYVAMKSNFFLIMLKNKRIIQARIARLVAYQLGTGEVPGSNPGKGKNLLISD